MTAATEPPRMLERHIQTMLSLAVMAMLTWAVYSLNQLQQLSVRQEERMISVLATLENQGSRLSKTEEDVIGLRIKVDRLERDN